MNGCKATWVFLRQEFLVLWRMSMCIFQGFRSAWLIIICPDVNMCNNSHGHLQPSDWHEQLTAELHVSIVNAFDTTQMTRVTCKLTESEKWNKTLKILEQFVKLCSIVILFFVQPSSNHTLNKNMSVIHWQSKPDQVMPWAFQSYTSELVFPCPKLPTYFLTQSFPVPNLQDILWPSNSVPDLQAILRPIQTLPKTFRSYSEPVIPWSDPVIPWPSHSLSQTWKPYSDLVRPCQTLPSHTLRQSFPVPDLPVIPWPSHSLT